MNARTFVAAAVIALAGLVGSAGSAGIAAASPVPNCGEWSHPTLVSPTQWGCATIVAPGRNHHYEHVVLGRR